MLSLRGYELSAQSARKLEGNLKANPSDMAARIQLRAYYIRRSYRSAAAAKSHLAHVIWMIENAPEHPILNDPSASVDPRLNSSGYERCKQLWLKRIRRKNCNLEIIKNAASFMRHNLRLSERLYRQAIQLDPSDPSLYRDLAFLLQLGARKHSDRMKRALRAQQQALAKEPKAQSKRYLLDDLAEMAFDCGEPNLARRAALKSVHQARKYRDWYTGNAIHDGNAILGRIALAEGDVKKALIHLKEASRTPGSPQLNSFGPNMTLAQELLKLGERKAVLSYLAACKKFWKSTSRRIDACIKRIEQGENPDLRSIDI